MSSDDQLFVVAEIADEIQFERCRQIRVEGWTAEHDDGHSNGSMALAAAAYATKHTRAESVLFGGKNGFGYALWPWDSKWWKPRSTRENLIKAGALIIAEIERLDRAEKQSSEHMLVSGC